MTAELLKDLKRVQAVFQQRTLVTILTEKPHGKTDKSNTPEATKGNDND